MAFREKIGKIKYVIHTTPCILRVLISRPYDIKRTDFGSRGSSGIYDNTPHIKLWALSKRFAMRFIYLITHYV